MSTYTAFGHDFDSQLEHDRYLELRSLQDEGVIMDLSPHPGPFTLLEGWVDPWGHKWSEITYTGDFSYVEADGVKVIEEVKPASRKAYSWGRDVPLRLKMLAWKYPIWRVRIWTPEKDWRQVA